LVRQVNVLGYANESAEDGLEALRMWKSGRYGLVITDCNMPRMDGYELSREIREIEREAKRKETVIIACTANALKGEAENCFAAGMNDYIAKPVELSTLLMKLEQWLPIPDASDPGVRESPPIDLTVVAAFSGGNAAFEREVLVKFRDANDNDVMLLAAAIEAHDIARVMRAAHSIKGASGSIGAGPLAEASERLEAAARANDWAAVAANQDAFHREAARLSACLAILLQAAPEPADGTPRG